MKPASGNQAGVARGPAPPDLPLAASVYARQRLADSVPDAHERLAHAQGTADILAEIGADPVAQAAAWLFASPDELPLAGVEKTFGVQVARVCESMRKLRRLRELHRHQGDGRDRDAKARTETLRRMLLAMSVDIRVVLLRLASRLQTLRRHRIEQSNAPATLCHETLELFAPLANRLGIWQLKWEMEDLAFRFLWPDAYYELARRIGRSRAQREQMVERAGEELTRALVAAGLSAEVHGRPKHLYSIHRKMQTKALVFSEVHDLLALRAVTTSVQNCYAALDVIHGLWEPVPGQYDDYISRPKPNGYQSLHSVVRAPDGISLEVQVRTAPMNEAAEYGMASHWRYKEGASSGAGDGDYESNIAWLRQLLAWQTDVGAALGDPGDGNGPGAQELGDVTDVRDDHIYALTPRARIIALPAGSTAVDFAYHLHTEVGHQCRGARVDGRMVPLSTVLQTGQTVEIISASARGAQDPARLGPSRDWLNPALGFLASHRAQAKVRHWFAAQEAQRERAEGRAIVERILQREGRTSLSLDKLTERLGFAASGAMFAAVARGEIGPRAIEHAARGESGVALPAKRRVAGADTPAGGSGNARSPVLVEGVSSLATHLARCCHAVPPDDVGAFVTHGHGISIHRIDCATFARLKQRAPERVLHASWSGVADPGRPLGGFEAEIVVDADDRAGLSEQVSDLMARQHVHLLRERAAMRGSQLRLRYAVQVGDTAALESLVGLLAALPGVVAARRA